MGIFSKIKKGLGIGTASITIDVKASHLFETGSIPGSATITAKSDLHFTKIVCSVTKETTSKKDGKTDRKTHRLGKVDNENAFDMSAGESRSFNFNIPIVIPISITGAIHSGSKAFGEIGRMAGSMLTDKTVKYYVRVTADAEGVALDPSAKEQIDLFFNVEKYKNAIKERL